MTDATPNLFAYIALLIWPLIALYLYSRLPVAQATVWTILGGYLLLPIGAEFRIQFLPAFNKASIPNLAALLGCAIYAHRLPRFFRSLGTMELLVLPILIGPFITSMLNGDSIRIEDTFLPGVGAYDAGSAVLNQFVFILPLFIGRQFMRTAEDSAELLRAMVIAGLGYSLLILFEIKMSPQLHAWIYGFAPYAYAVESRDGGLRPVVFIGLGLSVALFTATTVIAATALWRTRTRIHRLPSVGIVAYLTAILVLCKTLGALTYAAAVAPLVRWASPRLQMRVACVLVTLTLCYPLLRITDLVPTEQLAATAALVSKDRASSLQTRFDNEATLLEHAWERPWFGWGRYGRNRVYNGWRGADNSITDGYWIIVLGSFGIVGFAAQFGLFAFAVYRGASALKFAQSQSDAIHLAALALIIAVHAVDFLPNASNSPWFWLLLGAMYGRVEQLRAASRQGRLPSAQAS